MYLLCIPDKRLAPVEVATTQNFSSPSERLLQGLHRRKLDEFLSNYWSVLINDVSIFKS
jgi:hypothetical protein